MGGNKIIVDRVANMLTITIQLVCADDAEAAELHDAVCADAAAGHVMLDFEISPRPVINGRAELVRP